MGMQSKRGKCSGGSVFVWHFGRLRSLFAIGWHYTAFGEEMDRSIGDLGELIPKMNVI